MNFLFDSQIYSKAISKDIYFLWEKVETLYNEEKIKGIAHINFFTELLP